MELVELLLNGVFFGARLGLAGMGFALIFYTTKDFHFTYGALLATAGYVGYLLIGTMGVPALVATLVAVAVVVGAGMAMQYLIYRHLPNALAVMLISLGCTMVLENSLQIAFGPTDVVLAGLPLGNVLDFGSVRVRVVQLAAVVVFAAVSAGLYDLLHHRRLGLALQAVMRDSAMSELIGIKSQRMKLMAYAIGSGISALTGLLMVVDTGVRPTSGFDVLMLGFIVTVLGGNSVQRVGAWSIAVGVFMNLSSWQLPTQFQSLIIFTFMLVYVLISPQVRVRLAALRPRAAG